MSATKLTIYLSFVPMNHSPTDHTPAPRKTVVSIHQWVRTSLLAVSFWSAVLLPFLSIPLLATGLNTVTQTTMFLALLALNIVTVLVGHSYQPN